MKRLHISLSVADLAQSTRFYHALFNTVPTVLREDYARWVLEDPHVNFSISTRGNNSGVDHLGIQVDGESELGELEERLGTAGVPVLGQPDAACCYARSEKNWVYDPDRIAWETFYTHGDSPVYGTDFIPGPDDERLCCATEREAGDTCC